MLRSITLTFLVAAFCLVTVPCLTTDANAQVIQTEQKILSWQLSCLKKGKRLIPGVLRKSGWVRWRKAFKRRIVRLTNLERLQQAQKLRGKLRSKRYRRKLKKRCVDATQPGPTASLTPDPTSSPSGTPTAGPTASPTPTSTSTPTAGPTSSPTDTPTATSTPIPSEYEGFGTVTRGALDAPGGYETYNVTNLNNSGAGSLRDALSQGSRYVVFDVGGTITLTSTLRINDPYITIDGASAPSPGITIVQTGTCGTVIEGTSDIIIHHLRVDGQAVAHENAGDIWALDGSDDPVSNIIIDHVTGIASTDGVFDMPGEVRDVTLSWNLITDTVTAMLVKYGRKDRISLHHNVFARNSERQPQLVDEIYLMDYINNVIYGWGWNGWGYGIRIPDTGGSNIYPTLNVENNVFHYVSGYSSEDSAIIRYQDGAVYFNGNILPAGENDNYSTSARHVIPDYAEVTKYDASSLGDTVVPFAGTHYPTAEEQNLLSQIRLALGG